jgi:serine/threonine protein kinase/tetratricopeptide (TPR) repeat protein
VADSFRRDYLVRLPLPLAQLYSRAYNAKDPRGRHDNTFYLFEALVKLTAAPAIACYLHEVEQDQARKPALDQLLTQLALPSLGQWVGMLRELAGHFGGLPDAASHPLGHLQNQLDRPRRDMPATLALYRRIKNGPDGQPGGDQSCSLQQLIDALVQYRNGVFGHGGSRFESFYAQDMGPLLLPAAEELLAEGVLEPLGPHGSRLVYLTELRTLDDGQVEVGIRDLVGLQGERAAPLLLPAEQARALLPNRPAVLWPGRAVPLRLDPLLSFRESELADEVLFLNRDRHGRQVEYLSYTTGRTERDRASVAALAALLGRVTGRAVTEGEVQVLAEQSQAGAPPVDALFAPPAPAGRVLGDYEVLAELGRGGMGVVYLARQLSLGRLVALKMLPAELVGDATALARFRREIGALARCDHPSIVKILTSGTLPDGQPYYSMEYVPGCTLERVWQELSGTNRTTDVTRLDESTWARAVLSGSRKQREQLTGRPDIREGEAPPELEEGARRVAPRPVPLPPLPEAPSLLTEAGGYVRRVAALMRDAALALRAVHEQGIIHRDVKPGNLMLTPDGSRVVLMDFGLAKGQTVTLSASRQGGLLGTLRYAAPEQLASASVPVGPAADVRGLGATFWELLTRRQLFGEAADEKQLSQMVLTADVPRLRQMEPGLDRDLEAIVGRATERNLGQRIGSAGRVADYLQLYLEGKPLPIRPPGIREQVWRWAVRRKGLVATAASATVALVLLLVLALTVWVQRWELIQGVSADLEEVGRLRDAGRWREARGVLSRADERLTRAGLVVNLLRLLHGVPADCEQRVRSSRRDLDMANLLEEIPLRRIKTVKGDVYDARTSVDAYRSTFGEYGIDVTTLDPAEAAARIEASDIREQLIVALDYRAALLPDKAERERLSRVAQLADDKDWRKEFREALLQEERQTLEKLAKKLDVHAVPSPALEVVALGLMQVDSPVAPVEQLLREAQHAHPDDFFLNYALFDILSLRPTGKEEAIGFLRAAVAVRPDSPGAHLSLGNALHDQKKPAEAEAEYREALRWQGDFPEAHNNLGNALMDQKKLAEAETEFREALRLKPDFALAQFNLGRVLLHQGQFEEARDELMRTKQLLPSDNPGQHTVDTVIENCKKVHEFDRKLEAFLEHKAEPVDAAQALQYAEFCQQPWKRLYAASARLHADAFAANPQLAEDLQKGYRYDAACAAALAGCGQGRDADKLDKTERRRWRRQALDWLRADLGAWEETVKRGEAEGLQAAREKLQEWQRDADLADLRDPDALAKLPADEQQACRELWADVGALLRRVPEGKEAPVRPPRSDGQQP